MKGKQTWQNYEEVARYLLNHFRETFKINTVETKQKIWGSSGTEWVIDAKGVREGKNKAFIIVECRQYRKKRLEQEAVASLAFRIIDTGAKGGIIVSPLPLQKGAKKIASSRNIISVQLGPDSTPENFVMRFFNKIFVGRSSTVNTIDSIHCIVTDKD